MAVALQILPGDDTQVRVCSKCHVEKALAEFHPKTRRTAGAYRGFIRSTCRLCENARKRELWSNSGRKQSTSPEQKRERYLFLTYGITTQQFDHLLAEQHGCCAICHRHQSTLKETLQVDHDHATSFIRGLLCVACNILLGAAKDNTEILQTAAAYLKKERG